MKLPRLHSISLLWKILFSTSIALTVLFIAMGWLLQEQFVRIASTTLEGEVRASFRAYESLWRMREDRLATVSLLLSRMPAVRAAFSTGDEATIRDTASEMWEQLSRPETLFLVCDPRGEVIASVAGPHPGSIDYVPAASAQFPSQAQGFVTLQDRLYQIVVTPVYVATSHEPALLNVLVAGIAVDSSLANELKNATGGSDFLFMAGGHVVGSTLDSKLDEITSTKPSSAGQVELSGVDYYQFASPLSDLQGHPSGELRILRSFEAAQHRLSAVRRELVVLWAVAVLAGVGFTYLLARRLLQPVGVLDRAATEIAGGNYSVRVPVKSDDEMGRLAATFNSMCASLTKAREDLIRHERISTIGRLSTSIIHDLRNPLASIYGGAEMLVDTELSEKQVRRLAGNIYRASRQVQSLLQELADVTQGRSHAREVCRLREIITAGYEPLAADAESHRVYVQIQVSDDIELPLDRSPMERVFQNLIGNAIEAMPHGGVVNIAAERTEKDLMVSIEDNGPGIPASVIGQLFQPFVTAGKRNGVGLGLALSRKTVASHGGDLWADEKLGGARFVMRLPKA